MRKLDMIFPDLSLHYYRVSIDDLFGFSENYYFFAADCARAVERLETVQNDYSGFTVRFDTLWVLDCSSQVWLKCSLSDEDLDESAEYCEFTAEESISLFFAEE